MWWWEWFQMWQDSGTHQRAKQVQSVVSSEGRWWDLLLANKKKKETNLRNVFKGTKKKTQDTTVVVYENKLSCVLNTGPKEIKW